MEQKINPKALWGIFMTAIYLGMAALLIFSDFFDIGKIYRIMIGIALSLYGIARGYRAWKTS